MANKSVRHEILTKIITTVANNVKLKEFKVTTKEVPCTGINYTAAIYLITLKDKENGEFPLFAKVATTNERERYVMQTGEMFKREEFIYTQMSSIYNRLQDRFQVKKNRYKFPKFYVSHSKNFEETIVLENLDAKGYHTPDRFAPMTWSLAASAAAQLASFHALSFAFQSEEPDLFDNLVRTKNEYIFTRNGVCQEAISKYTKDIINKAMECLTSDNADKFRKFLNKTDPNVGHRNQFKLQSNPCLVHGDFKQGNVMVKTENGETEDVIIVDYQCVHYGSPINDLMYLIFTGTNEGFRSRYYDKLIKFYYNCLGDSLENFELNINKIYPIEDFNKDLRERLIYGVYLGLFILPYTLAEKKPDFDNINVNNNDIYKDRFNGIINDFVKWGYL